MNKATLKSRATLLGKVFESKGVKLSRAEQLAIVAQLEGNRTWQEATAETSAPNKTKPAVDVPFDALQLAAAAVYSEGDFNHMTKMSDLEENFGDTLFRFAILEIGDAQGDVDEAVRMLNNAAEQLVAVADHLTYKKHDRYFAKPTETVTQDRFIEILQHRVRFWLEGADAPAELDESSVEHLEKLIADGFNQGELCVSVYPDNDDEEPTEFRGWWSISM